MPITIPDLTPLIYDPSRVQQIILSNTTNQQINEPTNPFIMLLEAGATMSAAAATEGISTLRRIYPSLATTTEDILPHVSSKDLPNVFSYPSETSLVFYINVRDLKSNGVYVQTPGYFETILPSGTVVRVTNIPFTLLNDISIKLYDTGVVFAEQLHSPDRGANNSLGILPSGIVSFQDSEPWIAVETMVKQLNKSSIIKTLTISEGFILDVNHTDSYYYSDVYYKNVNTNNIWTPMVVSHSDIYIDPSVPTASVAVMENMVRYTIPDVYLISGQITGEIQIVLYETKGYLDVPIYKYKMSEYVIELNAITTDPVKSTMNNIAITANSRATVNGGKTKYTFDELRNSVIYNSLGHDILPITDSQLVTSASRQGFELHKVIDMPTDRVYIASRTMVRDASGLVNTKPDIYFNTVNIEIPLIQNTNIVINTDYIMIPSGTIFKEVNGITNIITDTELAIITSLGNNDLITYVANNNLFFTQYYYIIGTADTAIIDAFVYDLDRPQLLDIRIIDKNVNLIERVNVDKYGVFKTVSGYDLKMTILTNSEFDNSDTSLLHGQLRLDMFNGDSSIYFDGIYDPATKLMTFTINTNFNITRNNRIELLNGVTTISNPFADLNSVATITLFTTDSAVIDNSNFLVPDIKLTYSNVSVLDRETITLVFGTPIDFIWNKVFTTYTNRKYLTHTVDRPLVYKSDIYAIDSTTGSIITVTTDANGNPQTSKTLLHAAGTPVLDVNGIQLFENKIGDVVLDINGVPTIDTIGGVIRHVDIMMLEYVYKAATTLVDTNYLSVISDTIDGWLFTGMPALNSSLLENTRLLYKSYKKSQPIGVTVDSVNTTTPYTVSPIVTIYTTKKNYTTLEIDNLRAEIGYLIHSYLDTTKINLTNLKNDIISNIDNSIVSVKITNIEPQYNSELFNITDPLIRLSMSKILVLTPTDELTVGYDIIIKIHSI